MNSRQAFKLSILIQIETSRVFFHGMITKYEGETKLFMASWAAWYISIVETIS